MLSWRWRSATNWTLLRRMWLEPVVPLCVLFRRSNKKRRTKMPKNKLNLFTTIKIRYLWHSDQQVFHFHCWTEFNLICWQLQFFSWKGAYKDYSSVILSVLVKHLIPGLPGCLTAGVVTVFGKRLRLVLQQQQRSASCKDNENYKKRRGRTRSSYYLIASSLRR